MTAPELKILIVDDDDDVRKIGQLVLSQRTNWRILLAASGSEGISIARSERPDVVLLDLTMPIRDGGDTLLALKADPRTEAIPVILLTARQRDCPLVRSSLAVGAIGVIPKPFDPFLLPKRIRQVLGKQS